MDALRVSSPCRPPQPPARTWSRAREYPAYTHTCAHTHTVLHSQASVTTHSSHTCGDPSHTVEGVILSKIAFADITASPATGKLEIAIPGPHRHSAGKSQAQRGHLLQHLKAGLTCGVGFEGPLSAQEPKFRIPKASGPGWADRGYSHVRFLWSEPLVRAGTLPVKTERAWFSVGSLKLGRWT